MTRATPAAPVLFTDWFPCTRPPGIDGEYDVECELDAFNKNLSPIRVEFSSGKWVGKSDGINAHPSSWRWRGVRRWVLVVFDPMDFADSEPSYLAKVSKRGVQYWTDKVKEAKPFESREEAVHYATTVRTRSQLLWSNAVLP